MKKKITLVNEILGFLAEVAESIPQPLETPYSHISCVRQIERKHYYDTLYNLKKRGAVVISKKDGKSFIELTKSGTIQVLFEKAKYTKKAVWDGKWRLIIFDIPEEARKKRNQLRGLLKANQFEKLQASVFISPHPLNRAAIKYLQETGLIEYIRILRVDEIDNDRVLRKIFKLAKN
jgi:CRISPR-associated endonuclease Cas2